MEHSSTRSSSVSGVVSAIPASSTVRAFRCAHFVAHLAVHHRLRPRFTTVTRSTAHDPHSPTLDRIPNRKARARIYSNPGFCRGFARQESLIR